MPAQRILIVDDDPAIRDGCAQVLRRRGYECMEAETGKEALKLLDESDFDIVLVDLKMPDINGLDLISNIRQRDTLIPIVMITAYGTIQNAVEAMRLGANDFLPKPFDPEELLMVVQRTLKTKMLALENLYLREELRKKEGEVRIVGDSNALLDLLARARRVAQTDSTVLITGESGTGKGLLARYIHEQSPRKDAPFISVDCSTLVPSLFESELFGHVKGAFTGATENKLGKFELANGGTVFLDEIANINLDLQAKLLKVVEEKEITRVGSHRITKVDVRIIAATNKDLRQAVEEGRFREDLFFRLNVVAFKTPPLRDRKEDIPLLVDYFLKRFSLKHGRPGLTIAKDALDILKGYHWPGNVRELENYVERLVIFTTSGEISVDDIELSGLPMGRQTKIGGKEKPVHMEDDLLKGVVSLDELERRYVVKVLESVGGNKTMAAQLLGIDRKTLRLKLKRWGV
ncbi:Response regulator of zinc sigma-54-dependent two-component system [Dissulfuribacter thermophilus]|uniref:Response regulator of zinc sigma-54-dependent two-component system n=1 Tax=Dissulfuribacter thermophilus TaxID=1156395 RepID=A0A1B9F3W9_9BACT|nr:sigma-54 dependent transcriptional regulator [Dissulfuribacter thermophilus]OCC14639.1 Response regulator of zinc sigma-54-dependent two-component system [Dissulfuribacter thermophilus]